MFTRPDALSASRVAMHPPVSARLEAIVSLLLPCRALADVCSDHGLVALAAVQRGIAGRAICADLRAAPLEVARRNIARANLADRVTAVQGDGLAPFASGAVDAVVIAGVSGALIVRLLTAHPEITGSLTQLIAAPNQDADVVRAWALAAGFHLRAEAMVSERGYFFTIGAYRQGEGQDPLYEHPEWSAPELCVLGPLLVAQRDTVTLRACEQQRSRLGKLVARGITAREAEHALWSRACAALSRSGG